jgi:hypothetical protein
MPSLVAAPTLLNAQTYFFFGNACSNAEIGSEEGWDCCEETL